MRLRAIANAAVNAVNKNVAVTIYRYDGWTVGEGRRREAAYKAAERTTCQMQALDSDDLKQIDGLNLTGTIRAVYVNGVVKGVSAPEEKGGDILEIGSQRWLVTKVLEGWPTWTKAVVVLQEAL